VSPFQDEWEMRNPVSLLDLVELSYYGFTDFLKQEVQQDFPQVNSTGFELASLLVNVI